eukprot:TRINITY_DN1791_c0_g1_i1.p1 TRINITY_DN1791_c0_g1~~TRINITY_DN1791_c0_g1_i1.p1  ORF type:complete len:763 (+),score=205.51 TRINITY_DN1791_c0_g1_i1:72-2291(+)
MEITKFTLHYPKKNSPAVLLAMAHFLKDSLHVETVAKDVTEPELTVPSADSVKGTATIARYLARKAPQSGLYGKIDDAKQTAEVDQWVDFSAEIANATELSNYANTLNQHLQLRSVLAGYTVTIADIAVWSALKENASWDKFVAENGKQLVHLVRWWGFIESLPQIAQFSQQHFSSGGSASTPAAAKTKDDSKKGSKGSFSGLSLSGAKEGGVVTRFPPEPSGYLHIGHAKAALLNNYYATTYNGKLILRFDDTNPSKEKEEFVESIIKDLATLNIVPSHISYTSDFFPQILKYAEQLIKEGNGYIDNTPVEQMRAERFDGTISKCRDQTIEENLRLWKEMLAGSEEGVKCCLRGKIDMQSKNKCLRDPALARCNATAHHRTGTKYKCYPLYDFACPIVDSLEGVTHALRSSEYHDRNPLYNWVADILRIRRPCIEDFSRLNFSYTLLSKRKLQWFADTGRVGGWNDPRFPTIQGLLRRGLTVEALTEFVLSQGASKNANLMDIEKLWAVNKRIIDPVVPRYTAIQRDTRVVFTLTNGPATPESKGMPKHKKNESLGNKVVTFMNSIILEGADARTIEKGEEVTLMDWGNAIADEISTNDQGQISITGRLHLEGSVKDTKKKMNWLPNNDDLVQVSLIEYGNLITKKKLEEDDKVEDIANPDSIDVTHALGDPNLRSLSKGDRIQLERRGYFICDEAYLKGTKPMVLIMIPDGHTTREMSTLNTKADKPAKAAAAPTKA